MMSVLALCSYNLHVHFSINNWFPWSGIGWDGRTSLCFLPWQTSFRHRDRMTVCKGREMKKGWSMICVRWKWFLYDPILFFPPRKIHSFWGSGNILSCFCIHSHESVKTWRAERQSISSSHQLVHDSDAWMRYSEEVMELMEMSGSEDWSILPKSKERTARFQKHLQRKGTFQANLKKRTDTDVKKVNS